MASNVKVKLVLFLAPTDWNLLSEIEKNFHYPNAVFSYLVISIFQFLTFRSGSFPLDWQFNVEMRNGNDNMGG